jgi:positive regulator of sigma E activity
LVVTLAHGRLRTRAVAVVLSLVALLMTAVVVYGWLGTRSRLAIGIAALLTLLGAFLIARRYERLARERPLH